jgi:hypothetical protein
MAAAARGAAAATGGGDGHGPRIGASDGHSSPSLLKSASAAAEGFTPRGGDGHDPSIGRALATAPAHSRWAGRE